MQYMQLAISFILTYGAGYIGSLFTYEAVETWYPLLTKPPLNPPEWLFAPVWFILYGLMAVAFYRVWRLAHYRADARRWSLIFFLHLAFNAAWSVLFFGFQEILLALIDIAVLWVLIGVLMRRAYWIDRTSGYLLAPYFIWVSFALYLNATILLLN